MIRKQNDELKTIFNQALEKYEAGAVKYGAFDPANDKRNLMEEAEEELLDCMNYTAMLILQLRAMGKRKDEIVGTSLGTANETNRNH